MYQYSIILPSLTLCVVQHDALRVQALTQHIGRKAPADCSERLDAICLQPYTTTDTCMYKWCSQ
jgi:hypothetical protein